MKKRILISAIALLALAPVVGSAAEEKKLDFSDTKTRIGYGIGLNVGADLRHKGVEINTDALFQGVTDALSGAEPQMTREEIKETMMALRAEMIARLEAEHKTVLDKNLAAGEAFLTENSKKEGVKTLESGLQYKVIAAGEGNVPTAEDNVTVHYQGTLIDGTEFDSSIKRGQPATFPVKGVIPGWTEALQLMKEGAKWQIFVPSTLAYGERGAGQLIAPGSALIFDVELISINK